MPDTLVAAPDAAITPSVGDSPSATTSVPSDSHPPTPVALDILAVNLSGKVERVSVHGRSYLVVPAVSLVPGVLSGSNGSLYYPPDEVSKSTSLWDGIPITIGHPTRNGQFVSAKSPSVMMTETVGTVYSSIYNNKLTHKLWFDEEITRRVSPTLHTNLLASNPTELSTGLHLDRLPAPPSSIHNGTDHAGNPYSRTYDYTTSNYRPDHIAILLDKPGACSINDGCGVGVGNQSTNTDNTPHTTDLTTQTDDTGFLRRVANWLIRNCGGEGGTKGVCPGTKRGGKGTTRPATKPKQSTKDKSSPSSSSGKSEFTYPEGYTPPHSNKNQPNTDTPDESRPELSREEAQAIEDYTGHSYRIVNRGLHTGSKIPKQYEPVHKNLQSAFRKVDDFDKPVEVYRVVQFSDEGQRQAFLKTFDDAVDGNPLQIAGYQSTTTDKASTDNVSKESIRVTISAKRGLDADPYSTVPYQKELLLNHNESYRSLGVRRDNKTGIWEVEIEQV